MTDVSGLAPLAIFLALFVAMHLALSRPGIRASLVARLGRGGYGALNGIVSLTGLALVFWAWAAAPYIQLWPPLPVLRAIPPLLMPLACILFIAGVSTKGAGLRGDYLPPDSPGIISVTRHPVPWALMFWAAAHIAPNGDAASLMLFGGMLGFAALAPMLVDKRRRRLGGEEAWARFAATTATIPFMGSTRTDWRGIGWVRLGGGLALYAALLLAHEWATGVAPYP